MKKRIGLMLLAVMISCVWLAAGAGAEGISGEDVNQYGGTWILTAMVMDGTTYRPMELGLSFTMLLNADGSATVDTGGDISSGTWAVRDGQPVLTVEGEKLPARIEEGCLILENDMQKMVFEREGAPGTASTGPAPAPLIAVEDPEALTGTWEAGWVSMDGMIIPVTNPELEGSWSTLFGSEEKTVVIQGTQARIFGREKTYRFNNGRLEDIPENAAGLENLDIFSEIIALREDGSLSVQLMGMQIICMPAGDAAESVTTPEPTAVPTAEPTPIPTVEPTAEPTSVPTAEPTAEPTPIPTAEPTPIPTAEPTAEPEPAGLDPERLGEWYAVYMKTGRIEGDPKTLYKMDITLTLNGNHTGVLHSMGTEDQRRWSVADDGSVLFGEDTLTLREDGFLIMKTTQNSIMIFHQDPKAKWKAGTPIE